METRLSPGRVLAGGIALGAATYAAYVASTWSRYGRPNRALKNPDTLLDAFMPDHEVVERRQIDVAADADTTFDVACNTNLGESAVITALFKMRELIFGHPSNMPVLPDALADKMKAIGWTVLAEVPGREIIFGTATQPWATDVGFRAIPPDQFAAFNEPGYVKIAWTVGTDPIGPSACVARTETRVSTTDAASRARFRWYWSFLSPGIKVIRVVLLRQIKAAAEAKEAAAVEIAV
jgi:hypothetical protein